ncbi:MAG: HDIG domain-containing metalloprotein [Candidatus Heimdallarchaeaceae archaeon]
MKIPSKAECLQILKKFNTPPQVIEHCLLVTEITEKLIKNCKNINVDIAIAGAMLHDIGRSITHSLFHAVEGAKLLQKEDLDPRIIEIVKKHIGTGITREEAKKLGLPEDDYVPRTTEEIVVSYADNLACGTRPCSFQEALNHFIQKFGTESHVTLGFIKQHQFILNLQSKK